MCVCPTGYFHIEIFERATAPGLVMDIRDLRFEDNSFQVAIDKGNAAFEPG